MLNKQNGNMYSFVTHTWNPIKGKCIHDCSYCYMKRPRLEQKPVRLVESELKTDLGEGNYIFIGSGTDMWAKDVPDKWIDSVLQVCHDNPCNTYLFQSKNPQRFNDWNCSLVNNTILATTIETNRDYGVSAAPNSWQRFEAMCKLHSRKTVTIEPIMDFDLVIMVNMMKNIKPEFASIGADSKNHNLPEPTAEKVNLLINELIQFTKVKQKDNLSRLLCR